MREYKILAPTGILGYGFPEASFMAGVQQKPDLIACDAGSTDPGPYYLGSGIPFTNATAVKRDLTLMLKAACELKIPLVIGSAGGSGATPHLNREIGIIREIAAEHKLSFRMATISSEFKKSFLIEQLKSGKIKALGAAPELQEKDILDSEHIVAQMGIDPIIAALQDGAQVVLCGRCYDPAAFAAPAILAGYDKALAVHLGKILECSSIAATPGSGCDCIMGYLGEDYFRVEPLNPIRKCTPLSVSAHTLYEKSNPYLLPGPGGLLDISACTFEQDSERSCKVSGSKYFSEEIPTVKLEGAKLAGYRTISICGNRDDLFIGQLDNILANVKRTTEENFKDSGFNFQLEYIVYGRDGVMAELEPTPVVTSHEVGIVLDVVADSQEHASAVCSVARSTMLHYGYKGRIATAGNLAFPFSPSDIKVGPIFTFSVYHLLATEDPVSLFERTYFEFREGDVQ